MPIVRSTPNKLKQHIRENCLYGLRKTFPRIVFVVGCLSRQIWCI